MVSLSETHTGIRSPLKVQVLGWYDRQNLGDEFFKVSFRHLFPHSSLIFSQPGDILHDDAFLILGGGDVIKPYYLDAIPQNRLYCAIGVGLGYESEMDLLGPNLKGAWFRNFGDAHEAERRKIPSGVCPDLAFAPPKPISRAKETSRKKKMAVMLANPTVHPGMTASEIPHMHYGEYLKWEVARALDYLAEWYDLTFFSMSTERYAYDQTMGFEVLSRMRRTPGYLVDNSVYDPTVFCEILSQFDLVVSMKLHGTIFATIMGIPFVNMGLTRKTSLYCKENGLSQYMIEPYTLTADRLIEAARVAEKEGVSEKLLTLSDAKRQVWQEIAGSLPGHMQP